MEETKGLRRLCKSLVFLVVGCLVLTVKCQTDLVTDVQCYIHSSKLTNCSWRPDRLVSDLQFFYRLIPLGLPSNVLTNYTSKDPETPCPAYDYKDNMKTGCILQNVSHDSLIHYMFSGTVNNSMIVKNIDFMRLFHRVRAPPLIWNVTKKGKQFIIRWTAPDIPSISYWKYRLNYTECGEQKPPKIQEGRTSMELDFVSKCRYSMSLKAIVTEGQESEESDVKYFEAEAEIAPAIYAVILIPAMFIALAILALVCCRKHKEKILPKIPEPRNLLPDIFDNNNHMSTVSKLYVPAQEEEDCKITLVVEPQPTKSDS